MWSHVEHVQEYVPDRLYYDECFAGISESLIVDALGSHVDDVADPVKDPEDDAIPDEDLT